MRTATMRWVFAICGLAAIPIVQAGCDNSHRLGAVDGGTGGTGQNPSSDATAPDSPGGTPDVGGPGAVQSWTGYLENYKFESGSDALKISFAADSSGHVVGSLMMGSSTPPPPPIDPNVGYPPGGDYPGTFFPTIVMEGFSYPMLNATLTGRRLQFGVGFWELWEGWCALQTPVPGSSSCLPNWGGMRSDDGVCSQRNPATNQYIPVDCGKLALCTGMACICDASACAVKNAGIQISFDVAITNDLADGSTSGQLGDHNVHFTKDR